jgi:site-specific DNA recombinase
MKVAAYLRVSTQRQAQTQTIAQQRERIEAYCQQQAFELSPEDIFQDDGFSGKHLKRPGLARLREAVAQMQFERILITAPDRLARHFVSQSLLLEELQRFGGEVLFLDHPMSQDPHDQLLLQIRGAVSEYERTLITDRMRRGRQAKLKAGMMLPWAKPPYGYRLDPASPRDPRLVRVDQVEAALIKELFARYLEPRTSLRSLALELQARGIKTPRGHTLWHLGTLRGMLTNPVYTGAVYAGREQPKPVRARHSATHPVGNRSFTYTPAPPADWILVTRVQALISDEEFAQVQAKLKQNQARAARNNKTRDYLLRALVSCGHCLLACTGRSQNQHDYYLCSGRQEPLKSRRSERCQSRYIPANQLDQLVWQDLVELLTHPENLRQALAQARSGAWLPQQYHTRRTQLQRGQQTISAHLERLTDAYLEGTIPPEEYKRRRREMEAQQQVLAQQLLELSTQAEQQIELSGYAAGMSDFAQRIAGSLVHATFERRRQLVELLIDRVIVTDEQVEIRYVIPTSPAGEKMRFCHLRSDYFPVLYPAFHPFTPITPSAL